MDLSRTTRAVAERPARHRTTAFSGGRSSATASAWPAPCWACGARLPHGPSASWATCCCSRSSSGRPWRSVRHPPEARSVGPGRPAGLLHHGQRLRLGALVPVPEVRMPGRGSAYARSGPVRRAGCSCWSGPWLWTIFYFALKALGSWGPLADAWILTGSILATYGMARGWVEFWLIWIAVDAGRRPAAADGRLLPVGDHVHRLRRVLRDRLHLLAADRAPRAGGSAHRRRGLPGGGDRRLTSRTNLSELSSAIALLSSDKSGRRGH